MKKIYYIAIGALLMVAGTVWAVNVTVPQSTVKGNIPVGNANGTYNNGFLVAGSNITISTSTTGQISISATGGSGTFPFDSSVGYNSTSTTLGFLNGLFSTASSTFSNNLFLTGLNTTQGALYTGSLGNVRTVATSTMTASTGLTYSGTMGSLLGGVSGNLTVNTSQNIATLSNLALNGLMYTSGGLGTLNVVSTSTLSASSPLTGSFNQIGTGGSLGCQTASGSQAGCLSSADWSTFNGKQGAITLTTTGTSGASTFNGTTLNIPQYSGGSSLTGSTGQTAYFSGTNTAVGTSTLFISTAGNVGIGTTTPPSLLTIGATSAQLVSANPLFLLGTSTLVSASANGTYIGVNAPTGFGGNFIDFQNNGTSEFKVTSAGALTIPSTATVGGITSAGNSLTFLDGNAGAVKFAFINNLSNDTNATKFLTIGSGTGNSNMSGTSGNLAALDVDMGFKPTSGTSSFSTIQSVSTYNQTGNASGITRGVYVNPILTSAYDFRALETAPYTYNMAISTTTLQATLFNAPTFASTTAATLTNGYTKQITGAPIASTNVTISTSTALFVGGGAVNGGGTVTKSYGMQVFAPTGATNNYAASFMNGNVGIGTTTPFATLDTATASSTAGTAQLNPFSRLVEMTIAGVWYMIDSFDYYGHLITGGPTPTVSSCGTNPSIQGNDRNMRVYEGTSAGTSCLVTFAKPYVAAPICIVNQETGTAATLEASSTPSTITINGAGVLSSDAFAIHCEGIR